MKFITARLRGTGLKLVPQREMGNEVAPRS
jgi:hypothetical protein